MRSVFDWLYARSTERDLLVAALKVLVQQAGGAVVLSLDDLEATETLTFDARRNDAPEGVRILVTSPTDA